MITCVYIVYVYIYILIVQCPQNLHVTLTFPVVPRCCGSCLRTTPPWRPTTSQAAGAAGAGEQNYTLTRGFMAYIYIDTVYGM